MESRCPLCKQRFVTISKPARSDTGFDLRTVAIQVPERDQVHPLFASVHLFIGKPELFIYYKTPNFLTVVNV